MRNERISHLWDVCGSVLFAAGLVALAMLVLGTLAGATDIARDFAAQMETQVREQLWLALLANPVAWVCLVSALAVSAIVASLIGCVVLLLHQQGRATRQGRKRLANEPQLMREAG